MPIYLINKLQTITGKKGMNSFVVLILMAIEKEIHYLRAAYCATEKDLDRKRVLKERDLLDFEK